MNLRDGKLIDLGNFSTLLVTSKLKSPTAVAYLLDPGLCEPRMPEIRKLVDEEKYRNWRVYLATCAYGFKRGNLSPPQIVCRKAGGRANTLPWSRRYICGQSLGRKSLLGERQAAA